MGRRTRGIAYDIVLGGIWPGGGIKAEGEAYFVFIRFVLRDPCWVNLDVELILGHVCGFRMPAGEQRSGEALLKESVIYF